MVTSHTVFDHKQASFSHKRGSSNNRTMHLPAFQDEDCEKILEAVHGGEQRVVSHEGSSQYGPTPGWDGKISTSACGLAALNCARFALEFQDDNYHCMDAGGDFERVLLQRLLSEDTARAIVDICSSWTRSTHLEIEDLLTIPLFKHAFKLVKRRYGSAVPPNFSALLQGMVDLEDEFPGTIAAVITRPPEIILCLKIPTIYDNIFVIYDSHPRSPLHTTGAGFIINNSIKATATYLSNLLAVDPKILSDTSLQWQAQLLGHFSAHVLVYNQITDAVHDIKELVLNASMDILNLRCEVAELKEQESSMALEIQRLNRRLSELQSAPNPAKNKGKQKESYHGIPQVSERFGLEFPPLPGNPIQQAPQSSHRKGGCGTSPLRANEELLLDESNDSERMAFLLQQCYDTEDRQLIAQQELLKKQSQSVFDCGICLETFQCDYVAPASGCRHPFCRDCLRSYIVSKLHDRCFPIACPTCVAQNVNQPHLVENEMIQNLGFETKDLELYQEMELSAHSLLIHCRKCKNGMFVDKEEYQNTPLIVCPLPGCGHIWCKTCQQSIAINGPRHSCDGSAELDHLMKQRKFKYCPGCHTPIQRDSGCNHITCISPSCNTHFCYLCGDKIVQSLVRREIQSAISAHYRRCRLF